MDQLERDLAALAAAIDWPAAPEPLPSLVQRARPPRLAGRGRLAALALAAAAVAVAAALAVPQSRGAILRFLHLGRVTVELVDTLPAARERPLGSGLGPVAGPEEAAAALGGRLLLPPLEPPPPLHLRERAVSVLFLDRGEPVLLSELYAPGGYLLKKIAAVGTQLEPVTVAGGPGLWLTGKPHLFIAPDAPPRLAGNVLVWTRGDLTLRLEGPALTLARARELARSLR